MGIILTGVLAGLLPKAPAYCTDLDVQKIERDLYDVIYIRVPNETRYNLVPVVSDKLALLPDLVNKVKDVAIAGINAGYFDPANKQTTSYVIAQGKTLLNPVENRNFVENPALYPYLPQMLNRSELRVLDCNGKRQYDITRHRDPLKMRCKLVHSIQAGPDLFTPKSKEEEAFVAYKDNQRIRDPIGVDRKNARSAIGIDAEGNLIIAMASMKAVPEQETGVSLYEMARILRDLGAQKALSLDGGSSSTFWANGQTWYGKLDKHNNPVRRPIKSAFVVIREEM